MIASDCFKGTLKQNYKNMWRQKYKKMRLKFENYINRPKYFLQNLSKNPRHQNNKKKILRRWDGNELMFFCGMVDQRKSVQSYLLPWPLEEGLIIANLWYGLEPTKKLNSESVQWSCAKVITTTCSCQMKFAANCSFELLRNWSSSSRFPLVYVSKTSKIEQKVKK